MNHCGVFFIFWVIALFSKQEYIRNVEMIIDKGIKETIFL